MNTKKAFRSFLTLGVLGLGLASVGSFGCVASRDSRNGVFNENQYIRKDFLIRGAEDGAQDNGWLVSSSVVQVSSPNPLGSLYGIDPGAVGPGHIVRFKISQDHLQMVSMLELSKASPARADAVLDSWPVTNVDLKYRVNLDGETTNFYEENQEARWEDRQWIKFNPSRNDLSDLTAIGLTGDALALCIDTSGVVATLQPGSFKVDEANDYMQWTTSTVLPLKITDPGCAQVFGEAGRLAMNDPQWGPGVGHPNVTVNVKFSAVRANPTPTANYQPLEVAEKDPIRHKYGFFDTYTVARDEDSSMLASRQLVTRWNPDRTEPVTWYFAPGFPDNFKSFFTAAAPKSQSGQRGPGNTIEDATNAIMTDAGVKLRFKFLNYDDKDTFGDHLLKDTPREVGDVRYTFLQWFTDRDLGAQYSGVTSWRADPRTGEILSAGITIADHNYKDRFIQRIDAYLVSIGASLDINSKDKDGNPSEWDPGGSCTEGDTMAISAKVTEAQHANDSLYQKMQLYMQKPAPTFGNLAPSDFVVKQDTDFERAFFALLPYQIFADPNMNPYVIPEGGAGVYGATEIAHILEMAKKDKEFTDMTAAIDRGETPVEGFAGTNGLQNASAFLNKMRDLTINHRNLNLALANTAHARSHDPVDGFPIERALQNTARHCIDSGDGKGPHWESKQEWTDNLINSWWRNVLWHEFGHSMGLAHNFMGSVDKPNWLHYTDSKGKDQIGLYSSSVMEYQTSAADIFTNANWGNYDAAAISWIYSNNGTAKPYEKGFDTSKLNVSGQASATVPWNDAKGFKADGSEKSLLYCSHQHLRYTPFCRMSDFGATPSEIVANDISWYELNYQWRNFRLYRKFWDNSEYAGSTAYAAAYGPASIIPDMRRFILSWEYDWSAGELGDTFRRIGLRNPDPKGSDLQYYTQLANKFNADASTANQMVAAFHKAIIQQSSGERPFRTVYDKYYGDVTQQGIILDKFFAMQGFVGMWPGDAYDPNQAGAYFASYSGIGDASYNYIAEDAVASMIGGQYDVYPYFVPLAVAQFAMDTHSPSFFGRLDVRDWIGGHVFYRQTDFLDYFRQIAVENGVCTDTATCSYDPRVRGVSDDHNEFFGPDKKQWIWAYIPDRNTWVAVLK